MHNQTQRVEAAVACEQAGGPSYAEIRAQNEQLRSENDALWQALEEAETLAQTKQRELASTAFAMGLSLTPIVTILAVVLSGIGVPSRATVGRWIQHSCEQAGRVLAVLDEACRTRVLILCMDEIFFHQIPVLAMVEPHSRAWVAGQRGPDRTGETWFALLQPWSSLERVISDAGTSALYLGSAAKAVAMLPAITPAATRVVNNCVFIFDSCNMCERETVLVAPCSR